MDGPNDTKVLGLIFDSNCFTLRASDKIFLKEYFLKDNLRKNSADNKSMKKYPACKGLIKS